MLLPVVVIANLLLFLILERSRLYKALDSTKYHIFLLEDLAQNQDKIKEFYYLLCKANLIGINEQSKSHTLQLIEESKKRQEEIKQEFYKKYKEFRENFVDELLIKNNIALDDAISKAQKNA